MSQLVLKERKVYREMFPRPTDVVYGAMREDIRKHGQSAPIYCNKKGIILDGYTRHDILKQLQIEPRIEIKEFHTEMEEIDFILSMNAQRRDLTVGQKYFAFEKCHKELIKFNLKYSTGSNHGLSPVGESSLVIGRKAGISQTSVDRVVHIIKFGTNQDVQDVKDGKAVYTVFGKLKAKERKIKEDKIIESSNKVLVDVKEKQQITCPECGGTGHVWI